MKVGSSEAGAHATASHTASLAGSDQVYDGLFKQYGVYRARTIDELFDVAYACSVARQSPKGKRIGLLTVSGGVGALMADVATDCGLDVAPMPEDAQRRLKEILPFAGPRNPVDMTAQLVNDLSLFEKNFQLMLEEGGYDVVVAFLSSVGQVLDLSTRLLEQLKKVLQRFPDRTVIMSMLAIARGAQALRGRRRDAVRRTDARRARGQRAGALGAQEAERARSAVGAARVARRGAGAASTRHQRGRCQACAGQCRHSGGARTRRRDRRRGRAPRRRARLSRWC